MHSETPCSALTADFYLLYVMEEKEEEDEGGGGGDVKEEFKGLRVMLLFLKLFFPPLFCSFHPFPSSHVLFTRFIQFPLFFLFV